MRIPAATPALIGTTGIILFIILLSPLWWFHYFPTVDGPAHLYNAAIIRDMLFRRAPVFERYFTFNTEPVPNWTGHILMAFSGLVLPPWMTEKLVLLVITIGIPAVLIRLARRYGAIVQWHWLCLLPFTFTLILYLGFYNFLLSVVMLFALLPFAWQAKNDSRPVSEFTRMLLVTLLYFTHLLGFGVLGVCAAAASIRDGIQSGVNANWWRIQLRKAIWFLPGMVMTVAYVATRGMEGFRKKTEVLSFSELWMNLRQGAPLSGLNGPLEVPYTSLFICTLAVVACIALIRRFNMDSGRQRSDLLGICAGIMAICYFIVPDGLAAGGFVSFRILLLMQFFALAWLMCCNLPRWISFLSGAVAVYVSFATLPYRFTTARQLDQDATQMISLAGTMAPGSVVLPLNYSDNWLHINLSNYIGAAQPVLVLDNYETVQGEFPLRWKDQFNPKMSAGNFAQSLNPDLDPEGYTHKSGTAVTHIIRWWFFPDPSDSVKTKTDHMIRELFKPVMEQGRGTVFARKF